MNFFMFSKCGEGCGLLERIQREGNDCRVYIKDREFASVYDGILRKEFYPKEDDIIIFDSSGMGNIADLYRERGYKVFGGSKLADKLECDRNHGLEYMQSHGIQIPPTFVFEDFSEGFKFLQEQGKERFVFKPSGKEVPSFLTYVGEDSEDLIKFMEFVERNFRSDIDDFVLQQFVDGKIISSEFWCGARGFIEPMNQTVEVKKFMNDDIGPSTGCSGNLVWRSREDSEIEKLLRNCEDDLVSEGFMGPIDINCIVNEEGIYGLEWTPRFGLDAMPSLIAVLRNDVGQIISDLVQGAKSEMEFMKEFSGGVRLTIPPYPCEASSAKALNRIAPSEGIPIRNLESEGNNLYFYEVKIEEDEIVHSIGPGVIACVSGIADDCVEAFKEPMKLIEKAKIPDKQYRTDLGEVLPEMHEEVMEILWQSKTNQRRQSVTT